MTRGDVFLFDLKDNPTVDLGNAFETIRIYLPQAALDELGDDRGIRRIHGLRAPTLVSRDLVLLGLAQAVSAWLAHRADGSTLFADHLALALHDHVIHAYGGMPVLGRPPRGGLAPRQLRRAIEFINANLDKDPSITQLSGECGLSRRYFARAFRQSTGLPPHQWVIKRRIQMAKELLRNSHRPLAEIALTCGFFDQSHLTRAFSKREGNGPGEWRRRGIESETCSN